MNMVIVEISGNLAPDKSGWRPTKDLALLNRIARTLHPQVEAASKQLPANLQAAVSACTFASYGICDGDRYTIAVEMEPRRKKPSKEVEQHLENAASALRAALASAVAKTTDRACGAFIAGQPEDSPATLELKDALRKIARALDPNTPANVEINGVPTKEIKPTTPRVRARHTEQPTPLAGTFAGFRDHQNLVWLTVNGNERAFKCDGGSYLQFKQICLRATGGHVSGKYRPSIDGRIPGLLIELA